MSMQPSVTTTYQQASSTAAPSAGFQFPVSSSQQSFESTSEVSPQSVQQPTIIAAFDSSRAQIAPSSEPATNSVTSAFQTPGSRSVPVVAAWESSPSTSMPFQQAAQTRPVTAVAVAATASPQPQFSPEVTTFVDVVNPYQPVHFPSSSIIVQTDDGGDAAPPPPPRAVSPPPPPPPPQGSSATEPASSLQSIQDFSTISNLCDRCGRVFTSKRGLTLHMRTHSDVKPLQCQSVCPCEHCCRVFTSNRGLSLHLRTHFEVEQTLQIQPLSSCFHCGRVFTSKRGLSLHLRMHSDIKRTTCSHRIPDPCSHCGRVFNTKRGVSLHLRSHIDIKAHQCQTCHQRFSTSKALLDHRRLHDAEQEFQCNLCRKSFGSRAGLDIHMRMHAGQKAFKCETCFRHFDKSGSLASHVLRCHTAVDKKPFLCKICGQPVGKRGRKAHMSIHAQCPSCKDWFAGDIELKLHMATHPADTLIFPCTVCDATFQDISKFSSHLRIHRPGLAPTFDCNACGQSYANKFGLKSHQISSGHEAVDDDDDDDVPPPPPSDPSPEEETSSRDDDGSDDDDHDINMNPTNITQAATVERSSPSPQPNLATALSHRESHLAPRSPSSSPPPPPPGRSHRSPPPITLSSSSRGLKTRSLKRRRRLATETKSEFSQARVPRFSMALRANRAAAERYSPSRGLSSSQSRSRSQSPAAPPNGLRNGRESQQMRRRATTSSSSGKRQRVVSSSSDEEAPPFARYSCKLCGESFSRGSELTLHKRSCLLSSSSTSGQDLSCATCAKTFTDRGTLEVHIQRHFQQLISKRHDRSRSPSASPPPPPPPPPPLPEQQHQK